MDRRNFLLRSGWIAAGSAFLQSWKGTEATHKVPHRAGTSGKLLNAYYIRAHMYTCVPRQIREDMEYMARTGTDAVSIAILEQDLFAAVENVNIIIDEAERAGLKVFAVPSRWAGLLAGAPKVPSLFTVTHADSWALERDGSPKYSPASGRISSIFHPGTIAFMKETLDEMLSKWRFSGLIFDEPKSLEPDFHPIALEKLGMNAPFGSYIEANRDFFSGLCRSVKQNHPDVITHLFTYANQPDPVVNIMSETAGLDYYGCDGRPWRPDDGGKDESKGKNLLVKGERFLRAAKEAGKKSLWLLENHNMLDEDVKLMEKRKEELLSKDADQLIYYYYPRNIQSPDMIMKAVSDLVMDYRQR